MAWATGILSTCTHDCVCHSTLALQAALDPDTGNVCHAGVWRQESLAFLRQLARCFPTRQVHLIIDHYSPHRHCKVKAWQKVNSRFHFYFTATTETLDRSVDFAKSVPVELQPT